VFAGHAVVVLWLFAGPLLEGRVPYFRDIAVTYYPDYVYMARWLEQGVWPLWHQAADGGAPFLMAYPIDVALLLLTGARATLALSPALHVLLMMTGVSFLAGRLGAPPVGRWLAGACFGSSGIVLSSLLYPDFLAAAWLPWLVGLAIDYTRQPTRRRLAALSLVAALQLSTFGAAVVIQSAVVALVLLPRRPTSRQWLSLCAAAALAALLAAPALLGVRSLLAGSARAEGFGPSVALSYSANLPVLLESVVPRFFGDVHTFSDEGYWGQPFYPGGNPYYPSLYLGAGVLTLALFNRSRRLWLLAGASLLLGLGANGPLGPLLAPAMALVRVPAKFLFTGVLALCLLAGGAWTADRSPRHGAFRLRLVPVVFFFLLAALARWAPASIVTGLGVLSADVSMDRALAVVASVWPWHLATTAALLLGAALGWRQGGRLSTVAALLIVLDLLKVNTGLNPTAEAGFYDLRPEVARLLDDVSRSDERIYSYGIAHSPPLRWAPEVASRNRDVWLFYMDRQALLPRLHVLDGFQSSFDLDRMGWAPAGSTLTVSEASPLRFRDHYERFRRGNVRWVLSFVPLPDDLTTLRDQVSLAEVRDPLGLYEVRGAVPRAYSVRREDRGREGETTRVGRVTYERPDPHTVKLGYDGPPGRIVVVEGFHEDWRVASADGSETPLRREDGRYWAIPTQGGRREYTVTYRPEWLAPALSLCAFGALGALGLAFWPSRSA